MLNIFFFFYEIFWRLLIPVLWLLSETTVSKWKDGFKQRMGNGLDNLPATPIWFHAVSVGEFNAMVPILKHFSEFNIVISTTTASSQALAKKKLAAELIDGRVELIYMPYDAPSIIKKTFDKIQPKALIIMETEIWPSLINEAYMNADPHHLT
jgi:3-deoxy-D-manno-octulosonic-acid transferase